jgi:hypothetical protein
LVNFVIELFPEFFLFHVSGVINTFYSHHLVLLAELKFQIEYFMLRYERKPGSVYCVNFGGNLQECANFFFLNLLRADFETTYAN